MQTKGDNGTERLRPVKGLLLVNAMVWISLGMVSLLRPRSFTVNGVNVYDIYTVLMWAYGGVLWWLAGRVYRAQRLSYWIITGVTGFTILTTVTDQVGWWDLVVLGLNVALLAVTISRRADFNK